MKPRRDITLGEMQDECKRVFGGCALCRVRNECVFNTPIQPCALDLTDPPRFNDAQMAFWRGWHAIGAKTIEKATNDGLARVIGTNGKMLGAFYPNDFQTAIDLKLPLDLAELLGKDGE